MNISRRFAAGAAVLATTAALTAFSAPQAGAAAAAATYNGECGYGYKVVNSAPIGSQGTVFLTYKSTNGYNCVVTKKNNTSTRTDMFAYLYVPDSGEGDSDWGSYYSYAGPVYAYGKGMCIDWAGGITNQETWTFGSNCGALKAQRVTKGW